TIATGSSGHLGLYRLETQVTSGNGGLRTSGLGSNAAAREAIKGGFDYFKANASRGSAPIKTGDRDYHIHVSHIHAQRQRCNCLPVLLFVRGYWASRFNSRWSFFGQRSTARGASDAR